MDDSALEMLWEQLLSRRAEQVRGAFASLTAQEKESVLAHLRRMASETGWHPEQRLSAQSALEAIQPSLESLPPNSTAPDHLVA
jgi:hypothetical protein